MEWLKSMEGEWEVKWWVLSLDTRTNKQRPFDGSFPRRKRCNATMVGKYLVLNERHIQEGRKWQGNDQVSVLYWSEELHSLMEHSPIYAARRREEILRYVDDRENPLKQSVQRLESLLKDLSAQSDYTPPSEYTTLTTEKITGLPQGKPVFIMGGWPKDIDRLVIRKTETGFCREETHQLFDALFLTYRTEYRRAARKKDAENQ